MISESFVKIFITCYLLAISLAFFLSSYFNYRLTETISYYTNDGGCDPSAQGIGNHCFGDFYYPISLVEESSPWSGSPNPYPALALAVYKPFHFLLDYLSARTVLFMYLFLLITISVVTITVMIKGNKFKNMEYTLVLLTTIGSAPIMSLIDRGNSVILLFPIIYFWMKSVRDRNLLHITTLSCLAACLRPQFMSLCLILLFLGEVRVFLKSIFLSFIAIFISFLIFSVNPFVNFMQWVDQIVRYQDYAQVGSVFPVNVSFGNSMALLFRAISLQNSEEIIRIITYCLFVIFVWLFWRNRIILTTSLKMNSVLIAPMFFVGTAFHYYLFIFGLIFVNYMIESIQKTDKPEIQSKADFAYETITRLLFLLVLIPWTLPWSILPYLDASRGWPVIGVQWILVQGIFLLFALVTFYVYPMINSRSSKRRVSIDNATSGETPGYPRDF